MFSASSDVNLTSSVNVVLGIRYIFQKKEVFLRRCKQLKQGVVLAGQPYRKEITSILRSFPSVFYNIAKQKKRGNYSYIKYTVFYPTSSAFAFLRT